MRNIISVLLTILGISLAFSAEAVPYTCPAGWTLSGTTCSYTPTPVPATATYSCTAGDTLSGTTCTNVSYYQTQLLCNWGIFKCIFSTVCTAGGVYVGNAICQKTTTYPATATYSCPAGSTLSGTSCVFPTLIQNATPAYQCNPGDTLFQNASGVWQCQPPKLTASAVTNYVCADQDNNGTVDQFVTGTSQTKCRPDLLAYVGEPIWYCPVITGDPDPIVAGTLPWSLNGSLQSAAGYTVAGPVTLPGPSSHPIASSKKWVGGTTCSYQPPTVDGIYSFTTHYCADPTYVLDSTGMFCFPPKTPTASILSNILACTGNDVLNGATCNPVLIAYSPAQQTTYACPSTLLNATLNPTTGMCKLPMQSQPPTPVTTKVCGANAILNAATGMCDYVSIPAINNGGQYTCPALYTVGTGANQGWCIPTPQWAYPATWNLTKYDCPNGGTLGLLANGQPNGLCYLP